MTACSVGRSSVGPCSKPVQARRFEFQSGQAESFAVLLLGVAPDIIFFLFNKLDEIFEEQIPHLHRKIPRYNASSINPSLPLHFLTSKNQIMFDILKKYSQINLNCNSNKRRLSIWFHSK